MDAKESRAWEGNPTVARLHTRVLRGAHVDLFHYMDRISEGPWTSNPVGFKFKCSDRAGLFSYLLRSPRYGRDPVNRNAFREVGAQDSVHITVSPKGEGLIHLDSISIADRKGANGDVIYKDAKTVLRHIQRDLLHVDEAAPTPLDGPTREGW